MELLITFLGGLFIGGITVRLIYRIKYAGTLYINDMNQNEEPYIFLELDKDVYDLYTSEFVTLRVDVKSHDSHK